MLHRGLTYDFPHVTSSVISAQHPQTHPKNNTSVYLNHPPTHCSGLFVMCAQCPGFWRRRKPRLSHMLKRALCQKQESGASHELMLPYFSPALWLRPSATPSKSSVSCSPSPPRLPPELPAVCAISQESMSQHNPQFLLYSSVPFPGRFCLLISMVTVLEWEGLSLGGSHKQRPWLIKHGDR